MTIKDLKYIKINSVNLWYLIFNKGNAYFEEINRKKYFTLAPSIESKGKIKKHEEMWSKIRDLIRSVSKNADDYDEKNTKTKFNSDDDLPLNKEMATPSMIIVARAVFHENNKVIHTYF